MPHPIFKPDSAFKTQGGVYVSIREEDEPDRFIRARRARRFSANEGAGLGS